MTEPITVAIEVAKKAGQFLLESKGKLSESEINEKARNDFVTRVDHQSEQLIVDTLLSHFPEHTVLAEERGATSRTHEEYRWIIDPLDGTKNYIQDIPVFCISIALEKNNQIILGVVYDPVHDEIFSAKIGQGAYCNGVPIRVSQRDLSQALIATGFPFKSKQHLPQYLLCFEEIFLQCSGIRRMGSAALDLCYTAMGKFEGFWELGLSAWDIAAGSLIIKEAGGIITDFSGDNNYLNSGFVVCGNKPTHQFLVKTVNHFFNV